MQKQKKMLEKLLDYIHGFFKPSTSTERSEMLQFLPQILGVIDLVQDIIKDDDNDAKPDHVEKIIQQKMPDEIRKFIDEAITADDRHGHKDLIDLLKGS